MATDSSTSQQSDVDVATLLGADVLHHQKQLVEYTGLDGEPVKVTGQQGLPIALADGPQIDAFARLRVSNPTTLFDSKQLHDAQPRIWDDSEVSGSGTTSTHSADEAATTLAVALNTAGRRVRQTFMRFNYSPGKSQLVFMTGVLGNVGGGTGITRCMGMFDDENGLFFRDNAGTVEVVCRSFVTGSAVDTAVAQSSWNLDALDGTGASGITLDATKAQIGIWDFEWLGVGRVRFGFVFDGVPVYVHQFLNANSVSLVYMSTPNLPLRYEIENDGTGAASELMHICSSVISEGGAHEIGTIRYASTNGTHVDANTANTIYALVGLRLKSTHLDAVVKELSVTALAETNDDFEWLVAINPTVAGTFTYADETNSVVQVARGATANTVTGGTFIAGGFADASAAQNAALDAAIHLGSAIDGTRDELVLCARPLSANADIQGSITWRELV